MSSPSLCTTSSDLTFVNTGKFPRKMKAFDATRICSKKKKKVKPLKALLSMSIKLPLCS